MVVVVFDSLGYLLSGGLRIQDEEFCLVLVKENLLFELKYDSSLYREVFFFSLVKVKDGLIQSRFWKISYNFYF